NTEMWQIELFGDGNYFADASYVILGGSGEITDIHAFPCPAGTSCSEPVIHIYPPGTTYVEWNPHPNSVPTLITISDGEGIFHILSGSIDTLYISFALPPGYSINPYGAKIVDAEYVNFSVYADVVNPDGADTIWLFTNEPAAYPITIEGIGKIQNNQIIAQKMKLDVHPNPFNSSVAITAPAEAEIEIYDIRGNVVWERSSDRDNRHREMSPTSRTFIWIPAQTSASGLYLVKARMGDGRTITKRIVYMK
ncbi:T9SS type A sorting domain-containing protein, partial [bacterium]|nr:T9SS type A sorting domain-containing protein [bacterium]